MRERDQLAAVVSLRWFPVRELQKKCVYVGICAVFFFSLKCTHANTCVLRYHGMAGSPQESKSSVFRGSGWPLGGSG